MLPIHSAAAPWIGRLEVQLADEPVPASVSVAVGITVRVIRIPIRILKGPDGSTYPVHELCAQHWAGFEESWIYERTVGAPQPHVGIDRERDVQSVRLVIYFEGRIEAYVQLGIDRHGYVERLAVERAAQTHVPEIQLDLLVQPIRQRVVDRGDDTALQRKRDRQAI